METAYSWEAQNGLPPEIAALFPDSQLILAIPEYKVPLPGGKRDSQNDVFALLRDEKGIMPCMIEGKRDEVFGPTLCEWQKKQSAGKVERLEAICSLLGLEACSLAPDLRYQLFHRTASAVLTAAKYHTQRAAMVVQSFSPEHLWFEDYAAFAELFGLAPSKDLICTTVLPNGLGLSLGWASCAAKTESTVS